MKLTQLRHVTEIADRGSLRAAARHLGITQPAISRSVREIEHELGIALFVRSAQGVVLTDLGRAFIRRATTVQNELRLAAEEIAQLRGQPSGRVNVMLSSAVQMSMTPQVITPFREKFSNVHLQLMDATFPTAEVPLLEAAADFYVGPLPDVPVSSQFRVEKLFDNGRVVFGRRGHPRAEAKKLEDLVGCRWVRTLVAVNQATEIEQVFEQHGLPTPRVDITAGSTLAVILALAHSDLLTMLPRQWLEFVGTRELLQPIHVVEPLPAPPICIVTRARLPLTPAAEYLADLYRRASVRHASPGN